MFPLNVRSTKSLSCGRGLIIRINMEYSMSRQEWHVLGYMNLALGVYRLYHVYSDSEKRPPIIFRALRALFRDNRD